MKSPVYDARFDTLAALLNSPRLALVKEPRNTVHNEVIPPFDNRVDTSLPTAGNSPHLRRFGGQPKNHSSCANILKTPFEISAHSGQFSPLRGLGVALGCDLNMTVLFKYDCFMLTIHGTPALGRL